MKYRIVKDRYSGYEAQFKRWWWPFWCECYGTNTSATVERARLVCDQHAKAVVENYMPNEQKTEETK